MPITNLRVLPSYWWVVCTMLLLAPTVHAQRRDVVVMKNGDRITGQIKKLEHGQLFIETPYSVDPIPVDWLQVDRMESSARYQIETATGKRLTGTIAKTSIEETPSEDFQVQEAGVETRLQASDVVDIQSRKNTFWRQMKGSVDFGLSYASGSADKAINLIASTSYTSTKYQIGANLNSSISGKTASGRTNRKEISTTSALYLSRHAFVGSYVDFLTSSEQSLDLRTTLGGGYGRFFIRNNRTRLNWLGGVVYTNESYNPGSGSNPPKQNIEGLLGLNYDWFRFNAAEFQTSLQVFPGLSDAGRIRTNLNSSFSIKFAHDLVLALNLWDTFDSKPPVSTRNNELGVSTTLGFKF